MTLPARPFPRPAAQVEPYCEVLGPDLTVTFLLQFGGAELHLGKDPKGRSAVEQVVGADHARALATSTHRAMQKRVPLAKRWLAQVLSWRGHSIAQIARILRTTDVSVGKWLKGG